MTQPSRHHKLHELAGYRMKFSKSASVLATSAVFGLLAFSHTLSAQDLETPQLLHPASDSWPIYHGDYSGRRHSSLTQITPGDQVLPIAGGWDSLLYRP
jgi:alcohol dehydrogenase (cytochrome c)